MGATSDQMGNFKPDLIRFAEKEKGEEEEVQFEVVEIKYSGNDKKIVSEVSPVFATRF